MDHEVFVPAPAQALRQILRDPARVARCLPAFQLDAEASDAPGEPLTGRLKVRLGGHTITYRGSLTVTETTPGATAPGADGRDVDGPAGSSGTEGAAPAEAGGASFSVDAEGTEVRGTGSVALTLTVLLTEKDGGTVLACRGGSRAEGRLADVPADTRAAGARRLLERFAASLGEEHRAPGASEAGPGGPTARPAAGGVAGGTGSVPSGQDRDSADTHGTDEPLEGAAARPPEDETAAGEGHFRVPDSPDGLDGEEPPAEAAHARRTMIGRSAEEVDHAPPRGRYAPVPAPETVATSASLRWVAPAAALAIASAVVVGRVLRRRR